MSRGQYQLATKDAIYSDGLRYRPATASLGALRAYLPGIKKVLVLGAGVGSMITTMRAKGYYPHFTLVDNDKVILKWAIECLDDEYISSIAPVCMDALSFIEENTSKFDLVFIDIFIGRVVPDFVITEEFLTQCRNSLSVGGHLVFNYIINDQHQWDSVKSICGNIFTGQQIIDLGSNQIIIASDSKNSPFGAQEELL